MQTSGLNIVVSLKWAVNFSNSLDQWTVDIAGGILTPLHLKAVQQYN